MCGAPASQLMEFKEGSCVDDLAWGPERRLRSWRVLLGRCRWKWRGRQAPWQPLPLVRVTWRKVVLRWLRCVSSRKQWMNELHACSCCSWYV